jgi:aerobic carbon-monoxide dehydrogenase small subunit
MNQPKGPGEKRRITLIVNEVPYKLKIGDGRDEVRTSHTLAHTLRETLDLTGTKTPCNNGECGGCTVLMDGEPILSCTTLTIECNGRRIATIEGLRDQETGKLHPVQQAFVDHDAVQCGMCTPGMIMSLKGLFDRDLNRTETEVREAISGNLCRCTGYVKYVEAALDAAKAMREEGAK